MAVLPLALLTTAAVIDVLHLLTGSAALATAAWHLITAGLLLGIAVMAAQWLDRLFGETAVRTSGRDLAVLAALLLFGASWVLRLGQPGWEPTWAAVLAGWCGALGICAVAQVRLPRRRVRLGGASAR
ncbi:hypothetical protein [Lentzea sp. E54]|uniref:hypothetical protein n=1 Tax=Lentzea xerophila TaxID=3435883 RepID=UPI003DA67550